MNVDDGARDEDEFESDADDEEEEEEEGDDMDDVDDDECETFEPFPDMICSFFSWYNSADGEAILDKLVYEVADCVDAAEAGFEAEAMLELSLCINLSKWLPLGGFGGAG